MKQCDNCLCKLSCKYLDDLEYIEHSISQLLYSRSDFSIDVNCKHFIPVNNKIATKSECPIGVFVLNDNFENFK